MTGKLEKIIDESLVFWVAQELNCLPEIPPKDMSIDKKAKDDDWYFWKPIISLVTDKEIIELEEYINIRFPQEYKQLLKYKHFLELNIGQVNFIPHPSFGWQACITDTVLVFDTKEMILDRGYLPFASYSDWGFWCFGLNERSTDNECPIYLWDHEDSKHFEFVDRNLEQALIKEIETSI